MTTPVLLHIAHVADLAAAGVSGRYRASSLDSEGFLHCCYPGQLAGVMERYFDGVDKLVLLRLDAERLDARLVNENTTGGQELFPHIYGELPVAAIVERMDFGLDSEQRRLLARGESPTW